GCCRHPSPPSEEVGIVVVPGLYHVSSALSTPPQRSWSILLHTRGNCLHIKHKKIKFAQFIAVCSSAKLCEIGENLRSVPDPISRLQERLIYVGALIPSPTPQRRPVPSVHPYAAVARSSPPMSQMSEPPYWSLGDISLPAGPATLPL